jgi:catechol 2,3-dioxygenase-like lactoylglutathione lyase family enzyme
MAIHLDHTIVPSKDNEISARFFAKIFGLAYAGVFGHFAPVRINENLTLDFDAQTHFESHHYAFKVSEFDFDEIFGRVKGEGLLYGSEPFAQDNMLINHRNGGRGFYFRDLDGHSLEILTR